jgi:hypothetical protein
MLNTISNSVAASGIANQPTAPASPSSNNTSDASGAPVFAQVVQDALNRKAANAPNGAPMQQARASNSHEESPVASESDPALANNAGQRPGTAWRTQTGKQRPPLIRASSGSPIVQGTLPAVLSPLSGAFFFQPIDSTNPGGSTDLGEAPALGATSQQELQQTTLAVDPSTLRSGPTLPGINAEVSTNLQLSHLAIQDSLSTDQTKIAALGPAQNTTPEALRATAIGNFALQFANAALAVATAGPSSTETAPMSLPANAKIIDVSGSSSDAPGDSQTQPLTAVIQQLQDLFGSSTARPTPFAAIEVSGTPSQLSEQQAGQKSALNSAEDGHISAVANSVASTEGRGSASAALGSRAPSSSQATDSQHKNASAEDSSSGNPRQDASDSPAPADSPIAVPTMAKQLGSAFSDVLVGAPATQLSAGQSTQASSAQVPPASAPLQSPDAPLRPAADAASSTAPQSAPPLPASHAPDPRLVSDATLTNSSAQGEIRIAMQTDKLGAIELRAHVSGDEVGAAIMVEKHDAHAALAVELPALQQALSEKQLRVDQVALTQGSLHSTTGDAGANAQNGQRGASQTPQPQRSSSVWNEAPATQAAAWYIPEPTGVVDSQGRLSVQA